MTNLMDALNPPVAKKKRAPVDPNVKVLRGLARAGWGHPARDGVVFVGADGDDVYLTNTYMLRIYDRSSEVGAALLSFAPEGWDGSSYTLRLRASGDNYGLVTSERSPELTAEKVNDLIVSKGTETVVVAEWEPVEADSPKADKLVEGTFVNPATGQSQPIRANAKYLAAMVAGLDDPVALAQVKAIPSTSPILVCENENIIGAVMPVRI